jgi:hypothetical protein
MKHVKLWIATAVLGVLASLAGVVGAQIAAPDKAELALRAAMEQEDVRGDLKAAIDEYRAVVATYAKSNRDVAAQALLRMGQCYEKLGDAEARKAYQRLVTEFADQAALARVARERLAALAKPTEAVLPAPKFRRIQIPGKPPTMSGVMLSPDGTRFAFVAEGTIWTVPVSGHVDPDIAGEPVRLTKAMGAWDNGNCTTTWSVDGQWIAFRVGFEWTGEPVDSVYLVPASGGEPRRVDGVGAFSGGAQMARISVSQGARRIAFAAGAKGKVSIASFRSRAKEVAQSNWFRDLHMSRRSPQTGSWLPTSKGKKQQAA